MAQPPGVSAATVTVKSAKAIASSPIKNTVVIRPSVSLVHRASGTPLLAMIELLNSDQFAVPSFSLPHTGQGGFVDARGTTVSRWHYIAEIQPVRASDGKPSGAARSVRFDLPVGSANVDVENLQLHSVSEDPVASPFNPATLNDTFALRRTRTVYGLGDSLTDGAGVNGGGVTFDETLFPSKGQPALQFQGGSWVPWALFASEAKWTIGGVFATGGYTGPQIRDIHVPSLLMVARPGDTVVVLAGTNGGSVSAVEDIHNTLRANGLLTVACTIPPNSFSTLSLVAAFNAQLKEFCAVKDIPLVDLHAEVVDPATGLYQAAFNSDGVHPNQLGGQKFGRAIAATLNSFFPTAVSLVDHNVAFTGQLQGAALAISPVEWTNYSTMAGVGTGSLGPAANPNFRGGFGYKFLKGDTHIHAKLQDYTLTPGHRMRIGFAMEANATGGGGWGFRLESNTTGLKTLMGVGFPTEFTISQPAGRFYMEFTVPQIPDFIYRMRVSVSGGAGTYVHLGEVTIQDLTLMGL